MFNKQTKKQNIFLVFTDYFFKCEMGTGRGADDDIFEPLWATELCFGSWWELIQTHTSVCTVWLKCMYSMRTYSSVLHAVDRDKKNDAQRLPTSATDTYVWPACGHEALFAEALVWASSVHAARVLAWTDPSSWFRTLINVWKKYTQACKR